MGKGIFIKSSNLTFVVNCFVLFFFYGCADKNIQNKQHKVYVEEKNGKYTLIRNGQPYSIKGASGFTHLEKLSEIGGNTIRTYDTSNLGSVLDNAQANHIAVVVGLPVVDNKVATTFYDDTAKVGEQFRTFTNLVQKYKNHPALLMWCVGNELDFKMDFKYLKFFTAYNNLVEMVHENDPDHPVTTTVIDVRHNSIANIRLRTKVDLISINSFGGLPNLRKALKDYSWFWNGPYMVMEWGIKGPWRPNEDKTNWEAFVEGTSSKKGEQYLQAYRQYLPNNDPRLLGSFVFYWGQKQEYTHTWFSMFDSDGSASEAVGVMQYIWTGKWPVHTAPKINYMLLDNKGASDNLVYKAGRVAKAELKMMVADKTISRVKWELYHEDWYRKNNVKNDNKLIPIDSLFIDHKNFKATFATPSQEGPYRLYATVFDRFGNFATCNTPFYIVK